MSTATIDRQLQYVYDDEETTQDNYRGSTGQPVALVPIGVEDLHRALSIAPDFASDALSTDTYETAKRMFADGLVIIPRDERAYQVCDIRKKEAFDVMVTIRDCRRFAACSCDDAFLCGHIEATLALHLALAQSRATLPADQSIGVLCGLLTHITHAAGASGFPGIKNSARYYQQRAIAKRLALRRVQVTD